MATRHCINVYRLDFIKMLFFALLLLTQNVLNTQANEDYGESDDFQMTGSAFGTNDEIQDAAQQQQEVEISEHKNLEIETKTEIPLKDKDNITNNHVPSENNASLEHDSMSSSYEEEEATEVSKGKNMSNEEYEDDGSSTAAIEKTFTPTTTKIPEYVRKGKSENFLPSPTIKSRTSIASDEDLESNISLSDYINDDNFNSREHRKKTTNTPIRDDINTDFIVPLAMKFYQSDVAEEEVEHKDNMLNDDNKPLLIPQYQQLPKEQQQQNFHQNSSDEEYYEDSHENSEQQNNSKTTEGPTLNNYQTNNIARAAFPGFPLPFIGSWTTSTTSPTPSTTQITTNIPIIISTTTTTSTTSTTSSTTTAPTTSTIDTSPTSTSYKSNPYDFTRISLTDDTATPSSLSSLTTTTTPSIIITTTTTTTPITTSYPTTPTITTTLRTANGGGGKQGKQINISRRKLLPHEQLRNYIEDAYIRMPLAVIVDPSAESLEKTKALWRDALRTNLNIKIVLVSLNASGIPAAYSFNNTSQFLAGLNSIKEHDGGNAFIGIVHASELVPYDSAVFISTAEIPRHTELVQDAAITLLKKRIRLYLIWYGERATNENETQDAVGGILGEVAIRSGGDILNIVGSENSQELEGSTLTLVADALRGSQEIEFPVDTTLSSLHVKIDAPMRLTTLETPNGDINLKKLVKFKSRVLTFGSDDKRLDAYVPLTKLRKSTVFKLKMVPESLEDEYSVFVRADRKADLFLDDMIKRFDSYFMEGSLGYPTRFRNSRLQSITAALAAATMQTHDNIKFPNENEKNEASDMDDGPKNEVETFSTMEIHKNTENSSISSKAITNSANQRTQTDVLLGGGETKIELGVQSQVLVAPGMMAQLHYEVTNTRKEAIFHNIQVVDERRFLLRLTPQSIFVRPAETVTVSVTVLVPNGTPQGTIDRITFTCHGGGTVSQSLNLKVITTVDAQDTTPPSISWEYGSRCGNVGYESSNCAERFWTIDITAQDWETGIMRLQSTPNGLIFRNSYTIGSADPLKATYIATCCQPKVSLIAYDVAGNQRSYNIDVRDLYLTEASIAAIVLGSLLLLLLIILLIVGIVWCCRRRRVTLDFPTYRSHSTRSMD